MLNCLTKCIFPYNQCFSGLCASPNVLFRETIWRINFTIRYTMYAEKNAVTMFINAIKYSLTRSTVLMILLSVSSVYRSPFKWGTSLAIVYATQNFKAYTLHYAKNWVVSVLSNCTGQSLKLNE